MVLSLARMSLPAIPPLAMQLCELADQYCLKVDIPGYEKDEVKIGLDGNLLTVTANQKDSEEKREKDQSLKTVYSERDLGQQVSRSIRLPADINSEGITAQHQLGQLLITIQKSPEKSRTVQIQ
uniref:SHSP domain-containing protein n=1 Tax=Spongospora subterranea TaxID=70186 RepID=A0A0H5QMC8_9EUKA|eukprot:CRZ02732.1 hypothetical protein [Spongospora subterranea]